MIKYYYLDFTLPRFYPTYRKGKRYRLVFKMDMEQTPIEREEGKYYVAYELHGEEWKKIEVAEKGIEFVVSKLTGVDTLEEAIMMSMEN